MKYEDRGFIAELGEFSFDYDQWQQLTSVHRKGQKYAESYLYDFAGRLVATINRNDSSGSTIDFLILDGEKVVEQWRGAASQSAGGDQLELRGEYFWGPLQQQMIAARTVESDFDLVFTLTDALQSIIGVWNEDELRISEYAEYDPEGRISARAPDDTGDCSERNLAETPCHIGSLPHFGFTGAFRSTTTGLYRFGARWYSPRFGQFMSPDPLWYVDSFDVYGYAAFDPVNRWDPSGMASKGMGVNGPIRPRDGQYGATIEFLDWTDDIDSLPGEIIIPGELMIPILDAYDEAVENDVEAAGIFGYEQERWGSGLPRVDAIPPRRLRISARIRGEDPSMTAPNTRMVLNDVSLYGGVLGSFHGHLDDALPFPSIQDVVVMATNVENPADDAYQAFNTAGSVAFGLGRSYRNMLGRELVITPSGNFLLVATQSTVEARAIHEQRAVAVGDVIMDSYNNKFAAALSQMGVDATTATSAQNMAAERQAIVSVAAQMGIAVYENNGSNGDFLFSRVE